MFDITYVYVIRKESEFRDLRGRNKTYFRRSCLSAQHVAELFAQRKNMVW